MTSQDTAVVLFFGGNKWTNLRGDFSWLRVCHALASPSALSWQSPLEQKISHYGENHMTGQETAVVLFFGGHKWTTLLGDFFWLWVCHAQSFSKLSAATIAAWNRKPAIMERTT
jgi:hypothetical protein